MKMMDLQTSEDISAQVCTTFQVVIHIAPSVHLQLGALYGVRAKRGSLRVDICHVTRQEGSNDCGLFAIPYATECLELSPHVRIKRNLDVMRRK